MKPVNFFFAVVTPTLLSQQIIWAQASNIESDDNDYATAIGLRAGETSGMTFKQFVTDENAFEAIIGVWPYALGVTALYEKHKPAFDTEGMKWYYGAGGHATFGTNRIYYVYRNGDRYYYKYSSGRAGFGLDAILGLEYKIKSIPFAMSLDVKPFMELDNNGIFYLSVDPGLGIKIAF